MAFDLKKFFLLALAGLSLVSAAHGKGMRVWNDIVPHGGDTNTVRFLEHPEWYVVQEDGTVPDYWACDFNWPEWAEYMARGAGTERWRN